MSRIVRQDIDELNASLSITIEPVDYKNKYDSDLNKHRQNTNMKGFRKGKTPVSIVRKMYGKGILADAVSEAFQRELANYLKEEKKTVLLQPLLSKDHIAPVFDPKALGEYEFKVDFALTPDFEVKGMLDSDTYDVYKVDEISEALIDENIDAVRKRGGERVEMEEDIQDNDLVKLMIRELDGDAIKEGGLQNEFSLLIGEQLNEETKTLLLSKKKGDTFQFEPIHLEKDLDAEKVKKYYLDYSGEEEIDVEKVFDFEILSATRIELAEFTPEFLKANFGEEVSTEEEARKVIEDNMKNFYSNQAEALLKKEIQERIIEENKPSFPEAFLKRWIRESREDITEEEIEKELGGFKKGLVWNVVSKRTQENNTIEVKEDEIIQEVRNRVYSAYGQFGTPEMLNGLVTRMLQDQDQVNSTYETLLDQKVLDIIRSEVKVEEKVVSSKEMDKILEDIRAEFEKKQAEEAAEKAIQAAAVETAEEAETTE